MTLYAKLGAFVAWTLLVVFLTTRYDAGRDAIKEGDRKEAVAENKEKVEGVIGRAVVLNNTTVTYEVEKLRVIYRDVYKEAIAHETSGLDAFSLSAGWLRIHNEGASPLGVPEDTGARPVDDDADSGLTAAQALPVIVENYETDAIVRKKLDKCVGYVRALSPLYDARLE